MKTEEQLIKDLISEGYDKVYVWDEGPNESDEEHDHPFDTRLIIVAGSIRIKLLRNERIEDHQLELGSDFLIGHNERHSAVTGEKGCRYLVAEKHHVL